MKKKIFSMLLSGVMIMSTAAVSVSANDDECHPGRLHNVEYVKYDDTHHYKVCTIDGCTYKTSVEECRGGYADCLNRAMCEVCKKDYGDYSHPLFYKKNDDNTTHTASCNRTFCSYTKKEYCTYKDGECEFCHREQPEVDILKTVDEILNKKSGQTLVVYPNKTIIPKEYLEAAIKSKASFYVNYGEYEWELSNVTSARDTDISIKEDMNYIVEQSLFKSLKGDNSNVIRIVQDGNLGFKGVLRYKLDKKYADKYINLYYYNSGTKKLELKGSAEISAYGYTYLTFTHGGVYVLNITDKAAAKGFVEDFSAGESATVVEGTLPVSISPAVTEAPSQTEAASNPATGNSAVALVAIPVAIAAAAIISKKR